MDHINTGIIILFGGFGLLAIAAIGWTISLTLGASDWWDNL